MKIRQGFVSNSSSSSFIITGKDNISKAVDLINKCKEGYFDYYLINSKLYTCCIHDSYDFYYTIGDLASDEIEHHGGPYDDEKEVEGDRGVTTIYVPKYEFSKKDEDKSRIKDELYSLCKKWVYNHKYILDDARYLVADIYNLIGDCSEEVNDED